MNDETEQIQLLKQESDAFQMGLATPQQEPPQTFVIECNKTLAQQDGDAERTNAWTNAFPPIKLKKGDVVSVNSAFLSSRGSGDLLQFDATNNETRVLFEYYATNDNTNQKRPQYNYKGLPTSFDPYILNAKSSHTKTDPHAQMPTCYANCYPANYKPMKLYRLMKTFDTPADYGNPAPISFPAFTSPLTAEPFFSVKKESFWGYKDGKSFIVDKVEDKYIAGLIREPTLYIKETQFSASRIIDLDPNGEVGDPFFGLQLPYLRLWYVSTPMSKIGKCSSNATMRIYFAWGNPNDGARPDIANDDPYGKTARASMEFLNCVRVGEYIQFKNMDNVMGINSRELVHYHTGTGARMNIGGSSAFYCSGYASKGEGINISGNIVDRYDQFGVKPTIVNGNLSHFNDSTFVNPLGMMMKIVRINANCNTSQNDGASNFIPFVEPTLANYTDDFMNTLPFIEVQCRRGISVCFTNPNTEITDGIPALGFGDAWLKYNDFVSSPFQTQMRTWYMGANADLSRGQIGSVDGSTENLNYRSKQGTAWNNSFPLSDVGTSGKLEEKMYFCSRPYRYSPKVGFPTEAEANRHTGFQMDLIEEKLDEGLIEESKFAQAIGLPIITNENGGDDTARVNTILVHNYNLKTLSQQGVELEIDQLGDNDPDQYWIEPNSKYNYAGARVPQLWFPQNKIESYDDTQYSTATRVGSHNQGEDFFCKAPNTNAIPNCPNPNYNGYDNVAETGGYQGANQTQDGEVDTIVCHAQQTLNPNTDLYSKNQHGTGTFFYFAHDINNINDWNGNSVFPIQLPTTQGNKSAMMLSGQHNYVVGAKGLPSAYYTHGGQVNDNTGLWYGYESADRLTFSVPEYESVDVLDSGIYDYSNVMSQFPTMTYARFTNTLGQSEIMYIQIVPTKINILSNTHSAVSLNGGGQFSTQGNLAIHCVSPSAPTKVNSPAFFIIERDCEGTGKHSFDGTEHNNAFPADITANNANNYYSPLSLTTNKNLIQNKGNYFEILNGYANAEHQIKIDNLGRELLPIGFMNATEGQYYKDNFGDVGDNSLGIDQRYGKACGSDFYLCKYPNMPYRELTGNIMRMTDNMLRLHTNNVRLNGPARTININNRIQNVGHTGTMTWLPHYDFVDLVLPSDKNYFSPTDVANFITDELHKPQDLYKTWIKDATHSQGGYDGGRLPNGQFVNTAGKYPLNSVFRIIHSPSAVQSASANPDGNSYDTTTGMISGVYHEGDFSYFIDMPNEIINNGIFAYQYCGGELKGIDYNWENSNDIRDTYMTLPKSGVYSVFPPNNYSVVNTLPSTDRYGVSGYGVNQIVENQVQTFYIDPSTNFKSDEVKLIPRQRYNKTETFGSMYAGTNNAQLNYNTDVSRFEWKFLHQPLYSEYKSVSGSASGGNIVAKIWTQSINGYDNWDRVGGINVICWCLNNRNKAFGSINNRRNANYYNPLVNDLTDSNIGRNFMNKLGFSDKWLAENIGEIDDPDCALMSMTAVYKPQGTTASDYDIAQSRPYTQTAPLLSQTLTPYRKDYPFPPSNNPTQIAQYLQVDNTRTTIQGSSSLSFNSANSGTDPSLTEINQHLSYGLVGNYSTPPSVLYKSTLTNGGKDPTSLNVDDVKFPNYEVEVDSNSLQADELPKKTNIGYFLIMSDIIDKNEFIGSANDGSPLKCIGILSKNYENNDFFFSFQSPVEFYVKQDRTITSIKTEIKTPSLQDPIGLDYNSSIIYTIVRPENIPEPDVAPIPITQALDYAVMEQLSGNMGINYGMSSSYGAGVGSASGEGGGVGLNQLRQNLVSAVLNPQPNSAQTIYATQTEMGRYINRLPAHARMAMINGGAGANPNQIDAPSVAQLQMEGIGPSQPLSNPDTDPIGQGEYDNSTMELAELRKADPYVSGEQLARETELRNKGGGGRTPINMSNFSSGGGDDDAPPYGDDDMRSPRSPEPRPPRYERWWEDPSKDSEAFDDDAMSVARSNLSRRGRRSVSPSGTTYEFESPQGQTPQELFAEGASNTRSGKASASALKSLGLRDFFNEYAKGRSDSSVRSLKAEIQQGFIPDEPKTWKYDMLKSWAGDNLKFDWGENAYRSVGAVLNAEGRGKITSAIYDRRQLRQRGKDVLGKQRAELALPEEGRAERLGELPEETSNERANESLRQRVSRGNVRDPATRMDEKQDRMGKTTFWSGMNPYDLRTWSKGQLQNYQKEDYYGVAPTFHHPRNRLNAEGIKSLGDELRRRDTGKRKIAVMDSGKPRGQEKFYNQDKHKPVGYDHRKPHLTPHPSLGEDRNKNHDGKDSRLVFRATGKHTAIKTKGTSSATKGGSSAGE